ncbi:50S ribosomal protein L18 [Candidatus Berkelbacteria bacterium CG08_land_8_20_14_0_20_39_8]|uniref:Large ribosomal subunit protein uL18 n=1 Tax=Candidatus Berkelbacteria bacterium CG08_land_8_20_14_0_20_39_8 TaxID=1974511 RepID=A0A2M6YC71_9BACT|nr:MAG: 50S ribosomal protein L18 [Candidatus Berkelbacteria bacterium CG08_land_8_20_14_0_20_39_8]
MTKNINRKYKVSNKIKAVSKKPRLVVFRSNKEIYAQIVDIDGKILASASSLKTSGKNKTLAAKDVGVYLAEQAKSKKITDIVFDRRCYKYHGRIAALAEGARSAGLNF